MMTLRISIIFFTAMALLFNVSCNKEDDPNLVAAKEALQSYLEEIDQDQLQAELAVIDDSLANWGLTDQVLIDEEGGVRYILHEEGKGSSPKLNSYITFHYSGRLMYNGKVFDSGQNLQAFLYYLIFGFQTTLPQVEEGAILTLYIPSVLGYGAEDVKDQWGAVTIPRNSNLIFEIELVNVH
jgi:FKBP-type peptidyl-prolyl cis-trans isomerase FkpA